MPKQCVKNENKPPIQYGFLDATIGNRLMETRSIYLTAFYNDIFSSVNTYHCDFHDDLSNLQQRSI